MLRGESKAAHPHSAPHSPPRFGAPSTRRVIGSALAVTIAVNLPAFLTAGLAVQIGQSFHFGDAQLGIAIGAFYLAGALFVSSAGRIVEHYGATRALRVGALGSAALQVLTAVSVRSFPLLLVSMVLAGAVNAWAQPAANVFMARNVSEGRLGLAFGLQKSAIPAGALLGGLAVPTLGLTVGWRWAFVVGAACAVASAFALPMEARADAARQRTREAATDVAKRTLIVLAIAVGLGAAGSGALGAFTVKSGVEAGFSEGTAGLLLTFGSIFGITARLFMGANADRYPGHALRVVSWLFVAASISYLLFASQTKGLYLAALPLAFATGWAWPGLFHLAVVRANPSAPAAATGLTMTGTFTGAVLGPLLFGFVAEKVSYTAAWTIAAGLFLLAAVVLARVSHAFDTPAKDALTAPPAANGDR